MSDNSRSRVTVTLGRSGRVIKREGEVSQDEYSPGSSTTGSKRSVRDRLGGDSDDRSQRHNKRQHGESLGTSSLNDMHLGKHDLRFKLMEKNMVRQSHNNDSRGHFDLRDKLLSKNPWPSVSNKTMHPPEVIASTRPRVPEPTNTHITRHTVLEHRDTGILGRFPSSNYTSRLPLLDPGRTYSSWNLDSIRRRSPERSREELQRRPLVRAYDDGRSSAGLTRSSVPDAPLKSVAPPPAHYSLTTGIVQKIPSMGDDHHTVESLLHSLGLEKYAIHFKAEEIDVNTLQQLGDNDLKELGIPMGPRKKILQAVISRPRSSDPRKR